MIPKIKIETINETEKKETLTEGQNFLDANKYMKALFLIDSDFKLSNDFFDYYGMTNEVNSVIKELYSKKKKDVKDFFSEASQRNTFCSKDEIVFSLKEKYGEIKAGTFSRDGMAFYFISEKNNQGIIKLLLNKVGDLTEIAEGGGEFLLDSPIDTKAITDVVINDNFDEEKIFLFNVDGTISSVELETKTQNTVNNVNGVTAIGKYYTAATKVLTKLVDDEALDFSLFEESILIRAGVKENIEGDYVDDFFLEVGKTTIDLDIETSVKSMFVKDKTLVLITEYRFVLIPLSLIEEPEKWKKSEHFMKVKQVFFHSQERSSFFYLQDNKENIFHYKLDILKNQESSFYEDSFLNESDKFNFIRISNPDESKWPDINQPVDWEKLKNIISISEDIYYIVNLTNKDYSAQLINMTKQLKDEPHNKEVMVIDKVPVNCGSFGVVGPDSERRLFDKINSKNNLSKAYIPELFQSFVTVEPSEVEFWEVGSDASISIASKGSEQRNYCKFFIPPVKLNPVFGYKGIDGREGEVDLQGLITMFYIGKTFEARNKSTSINNDQIPCVKEVAVSDEVVFKISDRLTDPDFKLSVLGNLNGVGVIKYSRTFEETFEEFVETYIVEASDTIAILIRKKLTELAEQAKTISPNSFKMMNLSLKNYINNIKKSNLKFIENIELLELKISEEQPDVVLGALNISIASMTKDAVVTLTYSL